jgi:hypothetical protein
MTIEINMPTTTKPKKARGGKRPGAGRKTKAEAQLTEIVRTQIINKIEALRTINPLRRFKEESILDGI